MTAEQSLQTAIIAALRTIDGLNGVYDGPPVKASEPWAEMGDLLSTDWGTKDAAGREIRSTIMLRERAEHPSRLHELAAAADAAVQAIDRDLGGWQVVSLVLVRLRIVGDRPGGWSAIVEHRARLLAAA